MLVSFSVAQQPLVDQGLLIFEFSQSHSVTQITLRRTALDKGSLRRRNLYLITRNSQETDMFASGEIRTHNPSKQAAAELRFGPRIH
jgi:hypothetical protein